LLRLLLNAGLGRSKMAEFKLVLSDPKTGKSFQREAKEQAAKALIGKKIGDSVSGDSIGFPGYEFVLTGGSDYCGFPMRKDVQGTVRRKIAITGGVGLVAKRKGMRKKKTVAGNTVHERTSQLNLKITKYGKDKFESKEKPAEKKEVKPKVEKKEEKPAEKKEVKPKVEKKEEKPAEKKEAEVKPKAEKKEEKPAEKKEAEPKAEKKEAEVKPKVEKKEEKPDNA